MKRSPPDQPFHEETDLAPAPDRRPVARPSVPRRRGAPAAARSTPPPGWFAPVPVFGCHRVSQSVLAHRIRRDRGDGGLPAIGPHPALSQSWERVLLYYRLAPVTYPPV